MSKVGTREFMQSKGVLAYASVPREVILRAMAEDQCLDSRLRHAMILWSWCGPEPSEAVVRKDQRGYIVRDGAGNPIAAIYKDLRELLGLSVAMKGHVSRTAQCLIDQNLLRIDDTDKKTLYLIYSPAAYDPRKSPNAVDVHVNWTIAGVDVHVNQLPTDPVARHEAVRFIESVHAQWKTDRNEANARARGMLRTGLFERGILITLQEKKRLREEETPSPPVRPPSANEDSAPDGAGALVVVSSPGQHADAVPLGDFPRWWALWSETRGTNHCTQAKKAWNRYVNPLNLAACFECTASYLAHLGDHNRGYNPENFLREQSEAGFATRWPPARRPAGSMSASELAEASEAFARWGK